MYDYNIKIYGWVCPVCGRVMAPSQPWCPCNGKPPIVSTTGTSPNTVPPSGEPYKINTINLSSSEGVKSVEYGCPFD